MSKISRSKYQKLAEENKRLIKDIKLLVEDGVPSFEKIMCLQKWRNKFKDELEFNQLMQEVCREYIKQYIDELPDYLTKDIKK